MDYSRIYRLKPSAQGENLELDTALPGANDDDTHADLFDALRATFHSQARRQYGFFDPEAPASALGSGVDGYHGNVLDAEALGLRLVEHFKQGLSSGDLKSAWYLWFIIEQNNEEKFVYLFLLKQEDSYQFSPRHTITAGEAIRADRLHYAVKVSLAEWQSQSKTYLSYLAPKNQSPITQAWKALTGFAESIAQVAETEVLLTAIDRFAEDLPPEKEQDYRARVAEYCLDQDRRGEPVAIRELSRHVDEEAPSALLEYLSEHIEEPKETLYADRKQLKRYTRLFGRDNDLSIGFSTQMLGHHIIYDESTETLTIRSIPKSLKSQLSRYVKKPA